MRDKNLSVEILVRMYAIMERQDRKRVVEWIARKYRCEVIFDVADGRRAGYFALNQPNTIHLIPGAPLHTMFHELGHRFFYKMCMVTSYLAAAALLLTLSIILYYWHLPVEISLIFILGFVLSSKTVLSRSRRLSFHFLGCESAANWWAKREMVRKLNQVLHKQKKIRSMMYEVDRKMAELDDECLPLFSRGKEFCQKRLKYFLSH